MDELFSIRLHYKEQYQFGAYHSGFDLIDSIVIENRTAKPFSNITVCVKTSPEILLDAQTHIDYINANGFQCVAGDFIKADVSLIAMLSSPIDVSIGVLVYDGDHLIKKSEFPLKLLPYNYLTSVSQCVESLAFFVTPDQPQLSEIDCSDTISDPIDSCQQIFDSIRNKKITYAAEDFKSSAPMGIRLSERSLKERFANSIEFALLFASSVERHGLSPVIAYHGNFNCYVGICLTEEKKPFLTTLTKSRKNLDVYCLIDSKTLAFGSAQNFEQALISSKNSLILTDDVITVLNIRSARDMNLLPLPNRTFESGNWIFDDKAVPSKALDESGTEEAVFAENPMLKAILRGEKIPVQSRKSSQVFCHDLDVNQNKILSKIINNNFTLIRAQTGSGATTVSAKAISHFLKTGKSVLYLVNKNYHLDCVEEVLSRHFDRSFVWNVIREPDAHLDRSQLKDIYEDFEDLFEIQNAVQAVLDESDQHYSLLDGGKRIVQSFLTAADRYHQLRDANDSVIFSPEQIGLLSDRMVEEWFMLINDLVKTYTEIGSVAQNKLKIVRQKTFSYEMKSRLIRQLEEALRVLESIISAKEQLVSAFSLLGELNRYEDFTAFLDITRLFSEFSKVPREFFRDPERVENYFKKVTRLIQANNENQTILETILISFDQEILSINASQLFKKYQSLIGDKGFKAISQKHAIVKTVKHYLRPNCDVENVEYILSRLERYHANNDFIEKEKDDIFRLLSVSFEQIDPWNALQFAADISYQIYCIFKNHFSLMVLPQFVSDFVSIISNDFICEKLSELRDYSEQFQKVIDGLEETISNRIDHFYSEQFFEHDYFAVIYRELSDLLTAVDGLKNWCTWLEISQRANRIGLKNVIVAIEKERILPDELKRGFLRAFFKAVCEYNYIVNSQLVPNRFDHEKISDDFYRSSVLIEEKEKKQINAVLSMNRTDAVAQAELDLFTPYTLLQKDPSLFKKVFPCVVSDLASAQKMFRDQKQLFDFIIIENRDVLTLKDILWLFPLSKQMTYMGAMSQSIRVRNQKFSYDAAAFDYLWSLSDEKYSLSANYYASPDIVCLKSAFVNGTRRDTRSYSIPIFRVQSPLEMVKISGSFDSEYVNANHEEAQFVVDSLIRFSMNNTDDSVLVIASTKEQKNLILRLLAQKLRHHSDLSDSFLGSDRFHFSSVDEEMPRCDFVIFSAAYAPDRSLHAGGLPPSFRLFGGKDPAMALLEILSSARKKITWVTSFDQNDLSNTHSYLKQKFAFQLLFDLFCASETNNSFTVSGPIDGMSYMIRLAEELKQYGYRTHLGVQSGRYYIDLAISDQEGNFILGIISDYSVLNQKGHITLIELKNLQYLKQYGWKIYRLRTTNCFDSFDGELHNILQILSPDKEITLQQE